MPDLRMTEICASEAHEYHGYACPGEMLDGKELLSTRQIVWTGPCQCDCHAAAEGE